MNMRKTYEDVKKLGLDAQDRAYAKHLIKCRDKWDAEAMDRFTLEMKGKTSSNDWSQRAKDHADNLNDSLEKLLAYALKNRAVAL